MHPNIAPFAAYVRHDTGEIYASGRTSGEIEHAVRLAQAYRQDVLDIEASTLGDEIDAATRSYRTLEVIASGVNDLERSWPGAMQTTTYLSDGTGFYTRDTSTYARKLEQLAALHAVRPEIIHRFATAHEYVHGRGVTDERENHETLYRALERAIERTDDPRERAEYEQLLHVQARELELRYGVKKKPKRSERVLN